MEIKTILGTISLNKKDGAITHLFFSEIPRCGNFKAPAPSSDKDEADTMLCDRQGGLYGKTQVELNSYFKGTLKTFTVPLSPKGTAFQQKVWQALIKIPYGQTRTYGQIAEAIGHPKAARAVGGACNKNPIAIIIPCHRVVGSNQSLIGYAFGVDIKTKLLNLENPKR